MADALAGLSPRELADALAALPPRALADALPLVGVTAAAGMLGIKASNFRRDAVPHLSGLSVEGSAKVYLRSEIKALARTRAAAREAKANGHAAAG